MEGIIRLSHVSKVYGTNNHAVLRVLQDIDLNIEKGAFFTIIGPSGCGKSTLLNIMGGLISSSEGRVVLDGQEVFGPMPERVAMVFQESCLLPWRSVIANIEFPLEARGVQKAERRETAMKYMSLVGLSKFKDYYPNELSGGMQQRVSIARALVQEPEILLMDEPFGALDEQTRLILGEELTKLWETTGKTIVFVTHSLAEAAYLSDQIAVMSSRPGMIRETVNVTVSRPREPEGAELAELRRKLWNRIKEEASKQI